LDCGGSFADSCCIAKSQYQRPASI
jgi:hypothetical protein